MAEKVAAGFILYRRAVKEIEYLMLQTSYGIQHWTPPKGEMEGINIYYSGKHSFFCKEMFLMIPCSAHIGLQGKQ